MKEETKLFLKVTTGIIISTLICVLITVRYEYNRNKEAAEEAAKIEKYCNEYIFYALIFSEEDREETAKKRLEELNKNGLTNYVPSNIEKFKNAEEWSAKKAMEKIHNIGSESGQKKWSECTPAEQYLAGEGNWTFGDEGCSATQVYNAIDSFTDNAGLYRDDVFSYIHSIK